MSTGLGLLLGSSFKGLHALYLGPLTIGVMVMTMNLAVHGKDYPAFHEFLIYGSFMRYALEATLVPMLGLNRPDFPCPEGNPCLAVITKAKYILKFIGCLDMDYGRSIAIMSGCSLTFSLLAFFILKFRLSFKQMSKSKKLI
ncbi:uncharacterized protein LOC131997576 [Stomoxys calcitrans]|uniref:uncharacterized protein LOC131997576 n=1 Tax=Stomoxys calcitrans TaxID=35570 RepID=UPI0027E3B2AF|nr:uncharacterized protein LOC131997576 [Stomoxys calcitrans]